MPRVLKSTLKFLLIHTAVLHDAADRVVVALFGSRFNRRAWMILGYIRMYRGRQAHAIACFQRVVEEDPSDRAGWLGLGHAQGRSGQLAEAAVSYRRILETNPTDAEAWIWLGDLQSRRGRFAEAAEAFLYAVESRPADAKAWGGLAGMLCTVGKERDAIAALRRATGLADDQVDDATRAYRYRLRLILAELIEPLLPPSERFVVLDGGARDAPSDARWLLLSAQRLVIHGFEPDAQECAKLNQQSSGAGLTLHYHPVGLWSRDGVLSFEENNSGGGSSFLRQNRALSDRWKFANPQTTTNARDVFYPTRQIDIPVTSVANWAAQSGVAALDFVKLNVQGAEIEILEGCGPLLDGVLGILVEVAFVESYHDRPMFSDIDRWLRGHGFAFFDLLAHHYVGRAESPLAAQHCLESTAVWGQQVSVAGQLIEGHALYLRDPIAAAVPGAGPLAARATPILKLACFAEMFGQIEYAFELIAWLRRQAESAGDQALAGQLRQIETDGFDRYRRFVCKRAPV